MSTSDNTRNGEVAWRLSEIEKDVKDLKDETKHVPILEERIAQLTERVEAVTKVLWTIAGGLVLLVISVLIAAAQFGGGA